MYKRILILSVFLLTTFASINAKVRLPHLISDGMVIQQQTHAHLWGWAKEGKTIKVTTSWTTEAYTTKTQDDGTWEVMVKTPKASYTPLSITFDDGDKTTISNVYAGEVWVCAGQSNMEVPIKGFPGCPITGYNQVVTEANSLSGIHYCKIPSTMSMTPKDDAQCQWKQTDMNTVADQSAVGFFFARMVNKAINIPIGLIEANKGGSRVESWLTEENLKKYTEEPLDSDEIVKKFSWDYHRPLLWGNGTFHPIQKYTVKGILYYQGCSNVGDQGNRYSERLALLVRQWRDAFGEGNIPFYFVQIAPYAYDNGNVNGISGALLREQQVRASDIIPNSGLVCTNDLVYPWEPTQIHPCTKQPIGERLAAFALNRQYGFSKIQCESPRFDSMDISNDTCFVKLKNTYGGMSRYQDIEGFEVAGADGVFHKAEAKHFWVGGNNPHNESVSVVSKEVKHPVEVRYCFKNFQIGNLGNQAMLPLFPFRARK